MPIIEELIDPTRNRPERMPTKTLVDGEEE